jgi:ketosteroid isomerase-like protein
MTAAAIVGRASPDAEVGARIRARRYGRIDMSPSSPEDLRAHRERLVRAHMADENTLSFDAVLATFPHPHYELVPNGRVYDGHAEVQGYYEASRRTFPDQRNELISLRHADDAVVVEFWLRGTHAGGAAPSGRSFEVRMTAFFIFEGERLVCERVYFDALTIVRALLGEVRPWRPESVLRALRVLRLLREQTRPRP